MSESAQELTIDAPLADELERRGVHVHAGDRVRLQQVPATKDRSGLRTAFIGQFESPEPDLSERAKEIARAEMAR